jgi:hypothetical protein
VTYTKNHETWTSTDTITTAHMNNFETQYELARAYFDTHNHSTLYYTKEYMDVTYWHKDNDGAGSGSDADLIYKSDGNLHATGLSNLILPIEGLIILWYGAIVDIPANWHLCDGNSGTINLLNKIPMCAGDVYVREATGGSVELTSSGTISLTSHVITEAEMASHRHPFLDNVGVVDLNHYYHDGSWLKGEVSGSSGTYTDYTTGGGGAHTHSPGEGTQFSGEACACMPAYRALAYIQRIS